MKQRMLAFLLALVFVSTSAQAAFSDLPDTHWAAPYVASCSDLIKGYPDGTFRPDATLSVGEYLKLLCCVTDPAQRFFNKDVVPVSGHWATPYRKVLARTLGNAVPAENQLSRNITRLEMTRLYAIAHAKLVLGTAPKSDFKLNFTDLGSVSAADQVYIAYCVEHSLISGFPDKTFRPNAPLTRAQAAKVIDLVNLEAWDARKHSDAINAQLLKEYGISIARGEGLSDNAFAVTVRCASDFLETLPTPMVRALGAKLNYEGVAFTPAPKLTDVTENSAAFWEAYHRGVAQTFQYQFGAQVLSVIVADHYPKLLDAYRLEAEELYLYSLLLDRTVAYTADGTISYGKSKAETLFETVKNGKPTSEQKDTLAKCELLYQIVTQVFDLSTDDQKKIAFFPDGYKFNTTVNVSQYRS